MERPDVRSSWGKQFDDNPEEFVVLFKVKGQTLGDGGFRALNPTALESDS